MRPKSRRGPDTKSNLLLIDGHKHINWHQVFGNRTLDEVIRFLQRLKRMKGYTYG